MFEKNAAGQEYSCFGNHDRIGDTTGCQWVSGWQPRR